MDLSTYDQAKSLLLQAFNLCAPNGKVQRAMVSKVLRLEAEGDVHDSILDHICHHLHEGLIHDEWISYGDRK